jgi:thiosulfate reductase cytochrome b subunit
MSEVKIATGIDRIWHLIHALSIVLLILSGFNIHFAETFNIFGSMAIAVEIHELVGWLVTFDFVLWLFYNIGSGRFRFYLPNAEDIPGGLIKQARYYIYGIFVHEPHPFEEDGITRKFNPLQKLTYLGIMLMLLPAQIASGLALDYYVDNWETVNQGAIKVVFWGHTMLAYLFVVFVLSHIYLATTGETPTAHFKMMITGKKQHS